MAEPASALAAPVGEALLPLPDLSRAPDPHSTRLRAALAEHYGLPADAFLVGPGTAALLRGLVSRHLVRHGPAGRVVHSAPAFPLYGQLAQAYGLVDVPVPLRGYGHDAAGLVTALAEPALVLIDSPHNVTGSVLPPDDVLILADRAATGSVIVYDNVYNDYAAAEPPQDSSADAAGMRALVEAGVLVARSFSKAHRLFGLRVGYLIGDPELLAVCGPLVLRYDVGTLAQRAAEASLRDTHTVRVTARQVAATRAQVRTVAADAGLPVVGGGHGDSVLLHAATRTEPLAAALRAAGCAIRDPHQHGLPGHLQILVTDPATPRRVLAALTESRPPESA